MTTAQEFLRLANEKDEEGQQTSRYLAALTQGIDTSFILDLNRIRVQELNQKVVLREALAFLRFVMSHPEDRDINDVFQSYLRLEKSKEFTKSMLWSFLYSLEQLKSKFEEFWMITNILSSSRTPKPMVSFFVFCRQVICATAGVDELQLLDEVTLTYSQLNLVLTQIFGDKVSSKIFLIKNFSKNTKCSTFLSTILMDWIANSKTLLRAAPRLRHAKSTPKSEATRDTAADHEEPARRAKSPARPQTRTYTPKRLESGNHAKSAVIKTPKSDTHVEETAQGLTKEMMYLIKNQEETNAKIQKIRTVNADLIKEHNVLFEKGKAIYDAYFEIYYALKLEMKNKFSEFPIKDKDIEVVKKFQNVKKIEMHPLQRPKSNPMKNLF